MPSGIGVGYPGSDTAPGSATTRVGLSPVMCITQPSECVL
jgi:hypothetical protein